MAVLDELGDERTAAIFRGVLGTIDQERGEPAAASRRYPQFGV